MRIYLDKNETITAGVHFAKQLLQLLQALRQFKFQYFGPPVVITSQ